MPAHGILPQRQNARIAATHEKNAPDAPAHTEKSDELRIAQSQLDAVLSAIGQAITPEWFSAPLMAPQPIPLRDAPIVLQTIHNPTAGAVTVTFSLDAGSPALFSTVLAAGATLVNLNLQFPRLAGFVSGGYVTFGGTLPKV